jgi:Family of unknown function (DUF6227)
MGADPARTVGADVVREGGRPAEQLARLLDRAANGERAAPHLAGVRDALMHYCGLQSCRHAKGRPRPMDRRTYRHSFLLPDGDVRLLWELEHNTGPDPAVRYAVFTDREDLAVAEWEADTAFADPGGPAEPLAGRVVPPRGVADLASFAEFGPTEAEALLLPRREGCRRAYTENGSPEHAWRLLRRAANPNAPGEDVRRRLRAAAAHTISIVTHRSAVVAGLTVSWTLYEHAFLLGDGSEVSLWEIDHTRTPSGSPVCEVYGSRDAALDTAVRRIEAG